MRFIPRNIDYLLNGNEKQKKAYIAINELGILSKLESFNPILAGTIPLDVDTETSDLDIICESSNLEEFESLMRSSFEHSKSYKSQKSIIRGIPSLVISLEANNFIFEVFCQPIPVEKQYAVLHLNVEYRLLQLSGILAKNAIRKLKQEGIKTEPAFAMYFNIPGDPYEELAKLANHTDQQLQAIIDELAAKRS